MRTAPKPDREFTCDIPPHIVGMYVRACQKQTRAHKNWRRCFFVVNPPKDGQVWCLTRNARLARRYKMWDRLTGKYQEDLQVIVPYLVDRVPAPVDQPGEMRT